MMEISITKINDITGETISQDVFATSRKVSIQEALCRLGKGDSGDIIEMYENKKGDYEIK